MSDGNAQEIVRRDAAEESKDEGHGQNERQIREVGGTSARACHNDYVFATMEANYQQQASRDRIMPQLLDAQQELHEYCVEDWKEIIQDYHEQTQYCRDDFVECYSAIQQSIDDVQKGLENVTFVKQNSSDPAPFIPFEFDSQLVDLTTTNVQAGELVLNNLTVEFLRDNLLVSKRPARTNWKSVILWDTNALQLDELEKVKDEEDDPDTEADVQRSLIVNRVQRQRDLEREIEELKCTELKLQAHEELLLKVLEPLGEDDAPPFADNVYLGAPSPTQTVGDAQPTVNMVGGHTTEGNYLDVQHNQSKGAAKSMGKKFGLKFRKLMGRAKKDSQGEPDVNSAFSPAKDKGDSSSESYEEPPERRTEDELWYHGEMGRKEAENLCLRDGDYLVRVSGQRGYVLTTKWMSMPKHFIIQTDDEVSYSTGIVPRFEDQSFVTVSELLAHHASTGTFVTKKSGVTIKRPVKRKEASVDLSKGLSHDSVLMGARLGKGNFGDVYKAKLKHNNQEVAVKTCRSENFGDAEKFLNIDPVMEQISNSHQRNDGLMADICDGPGVSDHPLFGQDQHALQIILYYDDVELCNPLGANTKKHKLGVFYYTLGNLRPESRSLLHTIQLVALVKTRYINKYGICKILEPFMESVLKLEEGYSFTVKGTEEVFFGSLLLVCADNLAAQFIGGFKTLSAAMRKCRYCLATDPELQTQFVAESFHARIREEHKGYAELLDGPAPEYMATTYGVIFDSVLNRSKYFHVVDGLAPDVMHDILEGVLSYCTKLLLKSLILEEKLFRLQDINARIESFDYGYQAATSKPSVIAHSKLTTGDTAGLGQSASKMWCLCRYLPVLIGAWIPEDHWTYGLFLLLLKMLDIIMAPVVTVHKAVFLRQLISEHHELFCELYPMATITPKMHYMIHLPIWILRYGPMSHIWCMRFEARHKLLKRLSTTMCNFVNISKSLANRFQQYMCYQQLNEENYLKQDVSVPRTIRKCITDLGYNSCLMDRLQLENPETEVAASAEISGITYKRGCCVVTGYFDDLPEFGEIQQIVCHKSVVYLVVELLKTVQFDDHFHCFEVSLRTDDVWKVLLHSELHDYNVLHKNSIVDLSGQPLTVIVAKYDLEDR